MRLHRLVTVLLLAALAPLGAGAQSPAHEARRASLTRVEGVVIGLEVPEDPASVLIAEIETERGERLRLALAPAALLDEIGFEVAKGDRLRARIFEADPEALDSARGVQKVQNVSRGTMTRLRTLYRIPIWSNAGRWQGGPVRSGTGASSGGGTRHRGGR